MGFTHEHARLALMSTGSLEEATDYILTHPPPPPARVRIKSCLIDFSSDPALLYGVSAHVG